MPGALKIAGLFAGIGGIELGFHRALGAMVDTQLLCEWWTPAQAVLKAHFPDAEMHPDVRHLKALPAGIQVLAAGFPCTDLSQAGRTAGITGTQSSLVGHVFTALHLARRRRRRLPWLLIENVPNMLALDRGRAMRYLVDELEALGYRWAYRVVDSRATGVPQRRRRVLLVASVVEDPRGVLFVDDAGARDGDYADDAFGFYWTEGRGGLGWAQDAVPTLKGGSTIGIPSPPAIWLPHARPGRKLVTPVVEDAEELQGFPRGWTAPADMGRFRRGPRWKLVGNAVTVDVAAWAARRLVTPGPFELPSAAWSGAGAWPVAAWGETGKVFAVPMSEYPLRSPYRHLLDVVDTDATPALSYRGTAGFLRRLEQGNLGRYPGFRADIAEHADLTGPGMEPLAI